MRFLKSLMISPWSCRKYSTFVILTVVLVIFYIIQMTYLNTFINIRYRRKEKSDSYIQNEEIFPNVQFKGEKLVHFDFKGAPPKVSYLIDFIPFIKKLGATGVLLEYEDMFPYYGEMLNKIPAANAYTQSDIAAIVKTIEKNNLTMIPLIPTISHFEFVLKLEEFKSFREVEKYPHALCPNQKEIYSILCNMIDQILEAHPTANYIHIGGDEAYFIGVCPRCQKLLKKNKWRHEDIYFNHVKKLAQYVTNTYPKVRPILWGDRFLQKNVETIAAHEIPDLADIMLWNYREEENSFPRADDMKTIVRLFQNIWIASAFKGATGSTNIVTDAKFHLSNVKSWMSFVEEWKNKIHFKGIALTGWQRYSHFSVLCELLPVGVPSLALSLQYLKNEQEKGHIYDAIKHSLDCNDFVPLDLYETQDAALMSRLQCGYPGYRIYKIIHFFHNTVQNVRSLLRKLNRGDLSFYNVIYSISYPAYVHQLDLKTFRNYLIKYNKLEIEIKEALSQVYDQHTINEWFLTHFTPERMRLEAVLNIITNQRRNRVWPKRPLPDITSHVEKIFNNTCGDAEILGCAFIKTI